MTTIKTVAKIAGVSISTVSRVLSGKDYVNAVTKEKVEQAIRQTGYSPNVLAKSLKMGRSNTIALMVPDIQNLIFPVIARGVEDTARKYGFTVVLCNTDEDREVEKGYINKLKTRWIDGFIVCSMLPGSDHIRRLREEGFPLVLVNRYWESERIDTVSVNNYQAAYDGITYLLRTGHRRIAIALGRENLPLYTERLRGYRAALESAGIAYDESLVMRETNGSESFLWLTKKMIASGAKPDAVFATSDPKAFVILHALHELGIRIPEEVSVMGFDNVTLSAMVEPPLTTIAQPLYEVGAVAAKNLIRQIHYKEQNGGALPEPVHELMSTDLIVRRSTR